MIRMSAATTAMALTILRVDHDLSGVIAVVYWIAIRPAEVTLGENEQRAERVAAAKQAIGCIRFLVLVGNITGFIIDDRESDNLNAIAILLAALRIKHFDAHGKLPTKNHRIGHLVVGNSRQQDITSFLGSAVTAQG